MSWIDGARARLRLLLSRADAESRFDQEIRFHVDMEQDRLLREAGLAPQEARRQALVAFGGIENHRESLRDGRGLRWLGGMSLDFKLGIRMLAKSPGLTVVGMLGMSVAVAIGAVSFGIIYSLVGTSVPLDDGDRVVMMQNWDAGQRLESGRVQLHDLATWRASIRAVAEFGAYRVVDRNVITQGGSPEPARIAEMSASGFRIARVAPMLGRHILDGDERPGAPDVVVLGYDVWQERFAGDSGVIGRRIQLGATVHTVVGVMPPGFAFPVNNRVWTPLKLDPLAFERGQSPEINVFGRLAPGASREDAEAELALLNQRLAIDHPATNRHMRTRVMPYALSFFDSPDLAWAMHLIQLLVSMLLVVIGTNVGTLVYARTASRAGEIAVRTALGASRRRIVAQLFTEAFVLSSASAALGLVGANLGLSYIRRYAKQLAGEQIPYWMHFWITPGMVLYVLGLAVLAAVIVGVFPALRATRRDVQANLQQFGAGSGLRLGKSWTALIVAQVAIAVAMLPVVMYATFVQRKGEGTGGPEIPTREWITANVVLDRDGDEELRAGADSIFALRYRALQTEMVRRLRQEPAVTEVLLASAVPGDEPSVRIDVDTLHRTTTPVVAQGGNSAGLSRVDIGFFRAFAIPVYAGRTLQTFDQSTSATAVVVNRSFVRRFLGNGNALGRRVRQSAYGEEGTNRYEPAGSWYDVVGVVEDFPSPQNREEALPRMYQALVPDATSGPLSLAVRVKGIAPAYFKGRFREVAVAVDPMLRLRDLRALDEALSIEKMADRVIFSAVSLVTLSVVLLSAAGIYALLSFTIVRRRREIGIRSALGAGPRQVVAGVLAQVARQIGTGIGVGIALAGLTVTTMQGWKADLGGALLLGGVAAFMAVVGIVAAWGPARQALRIPPTEALRSE